MDGRVRKRANRSGHFGWGRPFPPGFRPLDAKLLRTHHGWKHQLLVRRVARKVRLLTGHVPGSLGATRRCAATFAVLNRFPSRISGTVSICIRGYFTPGTSRSPCSVINRPTLRVFAGPRSSMAIRPPLRFRSVSTDGRALHPAQSPSTHRTG